MKTKTRRYVKRNLRFERVLSTLFQASHQEYIVRKKVNKFLLNSIRIFIRLSIYSLIPFFFSSILNKPCILPKKPSTYQSQINFSKYVRLKKWKHHRIEVGLEFSSYFYDKNPCVMSS